VVNDFMFHSLRYVLLLGVILLPVSLYSSSPCASNLKNFILPKIPETRTVLLMGPAAAGKGRLSVELFSRYRFFHLSIGKLLRAEGDSDLGRRAQQYMAKRELVPDDILIEVQAKAFRQLSPDEGILGDGTPRQMSQLLVLEQALTQSNRQVDLVIHLDIDYP